MFLPIFFLDVYGEEPILISISSQLDNVVFDGKWTTSDEWKQSSYNRIAFDDGTEIHLRTAYQGDFIYVQINVASDKFIDKLTDSALICFDTKNDKTILPQSDDYCFFTSLDGKKSFSYQGNDLPAINGYFTKIPNNKDFIAVGSSSDKHDRYDKTPHPSYEFKIPLHLLGRSDNYGFFLSVFDAHTKIHYSWPHNIEHQSIISIPSPSKWGDLVSPDKSLPEFNLSLLLVIIFPIILSMQLFLKFKFLKSSLFLK
ncbi:Hypothetical protein Nlim_1609 [Candidatus Nitrosarchaeum limnium SFB1]|uniref:Carbohydrate-binding domain-containing protein n=1 Tax=Candidatus Nitrosarchaeum limnium SFB1 TaxID=886738 RepID=F3KM07_9ARCH|nr:Hypothetical protein Nlim_1609 [Candidatus Nitrosarchaeum limnium SFB1]